MLILFHNQQIRSDMNSYGVHIYEVLNGLTNLGHRIMFDDGQFYSIPEDAGSNYKESASSENESLWQKTKSYVMRLPFKNEILTIWLSISEIKLFILSFISIMRNRPDLIYWRSNTSISGAILGKIFRIPSVVEVNGIVLDEAKFDKSKDKLVLKIIDLQEKINLWKSDKYIAVTPNLKTILSHNYCISEDKISVIPNGANTEIFKPLEKTRAQRQIGLDPQFSYLCFVGQLVPWQGMEKLIRSMPPIIERYPKTKVLIVGDGMQREELSAIIERLDLGDRFIFAGRVPYEEVPKYINASDLCIAFGDDYRSKKIGASPLKLCEYLSCGKPVVAGKFNGLEFLEYSGCGKSVDPDDPRQVSEAICTLLNDPDLRTVMGEKGRKYVIENRSWASAARRVAEVCENAIAEHKSFRKRGINLETD